MTRQRVGLSLLYTLTDKCNVCHGLGRIPSLDTILTDIENWINRFRSRHSDRRLIIFVNEKVEDYILKSKKKSLNKIMFRKIMWIQIKKDDSLNISDFKVYSKKRKKDVTNEV